jgi:hypothetical protein
VRPKKLRATDGQQNCLGRYPVLPAHHAVEQVLETPEVLDYSADIAADLAGPEMSAWVRKRLRIVARKELMDGGRQVPCNLRSILSFDLNNGPTKSRAQREWLGSVQNWMRDQ